MKAALSYGVAYLGNWQDLNWLTVVLTIMLSQDNTVASRTGENKTERVIAEMAKLGFFSSGHMVDTFKWLTTHGNERQWQPSTGWSVILHRSGIHYNPKSEWENVVMSFFLHLNYSRGWDCSKTPATWSDTCQGQDPDTAFSPFTILLYPLTWGLIAGVPHPEAQIHKSRLTVNHCVNNLFFFFFCK